MIGRGSRRPRQCGPARSCRRRLRGAEPECRCAAQAQEGPSRHWLRCAVRAPVGPRFLAPPRSSWSGPLDVRHRPRKRPGEQRRQQAGDSLSLPLPAVDIRKRDVAYAARYPVDAGEPVFVEVPTCSSRSSRCSCRSAVDQDNRPVPSERYLLVLLDGQRRNGTNIHSARVFSPARDLRTAKRLRVEEGPALGWDSSRQARRGTRSGSRSSRDATR